MNADVVAACLHTSIMSNRNQPEKKNGDQSTGRRLFDKSLGTAASLSKLLPTGTTLAFQTLAPSFTKGGECHDHDVNFAFTWGLIGFLTLLCAVLSFTDSITVKDGNTYYGLATCKGFRFFNQEPTELQLSGADLDEIKKRMKCGWRDLLHALLSAAVFVALAFCDAGVQRCLVPTESGEWHDFLTMLPLAVGFLASFVFMTFPSNRKGIGEDGAWDLTTKGIGEDGAWDMMTTKGAETKEPQEAAGQTIKRSVTRIGPSTSYELDTVV